MGEPFIWSAAITGEHRCIRNGVMTLSAEYRAYERRWLVRAKVGNDLHYVESALFCPWCGTQFPPAPTVTLAAPTPAPVGRGVGVGGVTRDALARRRGEGETRMVGAG